MDQPEHDTVLWQVSTTLFSFRRMVFNGIAFDFEPLDAISQNFDGGICLVLWRLLFVDIQIMVAQRFGQTIGAFQEIRDHTKFGGRRECASF